MHNSDEMLTAHRDETLGSSSTFLLQASKDLLRAATLSSKTLLNGKLKGATASDLAKHSRLCSDQMTSSFKKRPAPSSNSKPKHKKDKVVLQPRQVFVKPNIPKKQQKRSYRTQQRPKPYNFKAVPAVPKAQR